MVTHVFDNIDWKNKNVQRTETHHTNSILVQKYDITEDLAKISLEPKYHFNRKKHRSYKGKHQKLPSVNFKRAKPKLLPYPSYHEHQEYDRLSLKTLAWMYARLHKNDSSNNQKIPAWSAFQELSTQVLPNQINVGYLPPITDSTTEMKIIYAAIYRSLDIMNELDIKFIFLEVDQATYTKVLNAMFKMEAKGFEIFKKVIPRMGGFHIGICMLRTIYEQFNRCGIIELLSAADLEGKVTIKRNLKGVGVKERILLHKKLFEALLRHEVAYIQNQCLDESEDAVFTSLLDKLQTIITYETVDSMIHYYRHKAFPTLNGAVAAFMNIYLEMVNVFLNVLHFLRVGNWEGYLKTIREFLPRCFSLNRHNYARSLLYYYIHMLSLNEENLEAFQYIHDDGFTGSLSRRSHSMIPMDQIIEMTINRSCKEIGGLSGKTENVGASERWAKIHHHMVARREHLNEKVRKNAKDVNIELGALRIERDERDV